MSGKGTPPEGEETPLLEQTGATGALGDRDRRLLEALGDPVARAILAALSEAERDGHGLVLATGLPQSSVYRKLRELEESDLVRVVRLAFTTEGRKVDVFATAIRQISVEFAGGRTLLRVRATSDSSDRLHELWERVRGG